MSPQLLLPPQPPWPACLASSLTNLAIIVIGGWLKEAEEEGEAQAVQAQAGELLVTAPATRCCCSRAASMKSLRTLLVAMLLLRTGLVVVRRRGGAGPTHDCRLVAGSRLRAMTPRRRGPALSPAAVTARQ